MIARAAAVLPRRLPLIVVLLATGLALRLVIALVLLPGSGHESDLRLFGRWAQALASHGPGGFYANAGFIDYPPGYLYVLWLVGALGDAVAGLFGAPVADGIAALVKLPAIGADLLIAVLLYAEASRWRGQRAGLVAAGAFLFIPVTWYDSAVWGQVDSVGTLVLLAAVVLLLRGWSEPALVAAALATLVKPQYAIVFGLVAVVLVRRHLLMPGSGPRPGRTGILRRLDPRLASWFTDYQGRLRLAAAGVAAAAVGLLVILPFDLPAVAARDVAGVPVVGHVAGLLSVVGAAANYYNVLTANAFNPWALVGPTPLSQALSGNYQWTYDSLGVVGGVSAMAVGALLFGIVAVLVVATLIMRDERRLIVVGITVLAIAFFVLPTRVHERYLFPAFASGALLAATSQRWRWWYLIAGMANVANLHAILTLPQDGYATSVVANLPLGGLMRQDWMITLIALTCAGLLLGALVALLGRIGWWPVWLRANRVALRENLGRLFAAPRHELAASAERDTSRDHGSGRGGFDRRDALACALVFLVILGTRMWRLETPRTMYFDEGLHVPTAMEFMQDWRYGQPHELYEWTHPHLAKYLMAVGLMTLGGNRLDHLELAAPAIDVAFQPAFAADSAGALGGDRIAIATGDRVMLATHGKLDDLTAIQLPGAVSVSFDPAADSLYVGTDSGGLWLLDGAAMTSMNPKPVQIGQLQSPASRIWALGAGRLIAWSTGGALSSVELNTGRPAASIDAPDLAGVIPVQTESGVIVVVARREGLVAHDPATLAILQTATLPSAPRGMTLVDGSERGRLDREMLAVPTLFVALSNWTLATFEVGSSGALTPAQGLTMPGPVRDVRWDRATNMVHVLGSSKGGGPTIYEVEPQRRTVFADAPLPFEPSAWVLDTQPNEPGLDRQRALAFSTSGLVAVVAIGGDSFAWRLPGVIAGALMAALLYLLARILFRRRSVALLLAAMLPLEGLLFSQSRIGMNDAFVGLFVVAGLTLLAYLFEARGPSRHPRAALLVGLPVLGLLFGLALAAKWVALYAIATAVLLILLRSPIGRWLALAGFVGLGGLLGWQAIADRQPNFIFVILVVVLVVVVARLVARARSVVDGPAWVDPRRARGLPFAWALVCLSVIPLVVYVASYVPWALSAGGSPQLFAGWPAGHTGQTFLDLQAQMYRFHDELRQQHGAASPWWAWPLDLKPVWGYYETFVDGTRSMVFGTANPALLWPAIAALAALGWRAWKRAHRRLAFVAIAFLGAWLPWVRIDRFTVNYHYYVALPFAMLALAWLLAELWRGPPPRLWLLARVAVGVALVAPALLWVLKDPLCGLAGVSQANPGLSVCTASLGDFALPVSAWWIFTGIAALVLFRFARPRQLVTLVIASAAVVFLALYPVLAAVRLPGDWPVLYQGLLPTWDGSFQFAVNLLPAAREPLIGLGSLILGGVLAVLAILIVRHPQVDRSQPPPKAKRGETLPIRTRPIIPDGAGARISRFLSRHAARAQRRPAWTRSTAAAVLLLVVVSAVATLVATRFSGLGGGHLWNFDLPLVFHPMATLLHEALTNGHLPFWSDRPWMGVPLYAEPQTGAFYPPSWLTFQLPPLTAIDVTRWVHLVFAGVGAGVLALRLTGSRPGAVVTALVTVLAGGIVSKVEWTSVVTTYAWIPWVLLPLLWRRGALTWQAVALSASLWGVQLLAGHPPYWTLTGFVAIAIVVARTRTNVLAWLVGGAARLALFGAVGLGVAAVQLLPLLTLVRQSRLASGLSPAELTEYSATPLDMLGLAFANVFTPARQPALDLGQTWYSGGFWAFLESYAYVGLPVLIAASLAIPVRRSRTIWLLAMAMVALPVLLPLTAQLWAATPLLNGLRHPVRAYMLLDLLLALLAGIGVARLSRGERTLAPLVVTGAFVIGYGLLALTLTAAPQLLPPLAGYATLETGVVDRARAALSQAWPLVLELAAAALAIGVVWLARPRRGEPAFSTRRGRRAQWALVGVVAVPLALLVPQLNQMRGEGDFTTAGSSLASLVEAQQPRRVLAIEEPYYPTLTAALQDTGARNPGVHSLEFVFPLRLAATDRLEAALRSRPDSDLTRAIGVDIIVAFKDQPCAGRVVGYDPQYQATVCRLDDAARTPYWLPATAVVVPGDRTAPPPVDALIDPSKALRSWQPATVAAWDAQSALMIVDAPEAGYLFIDRAWYPMWQVSVNGQAVAPLRAWSGQLVPVPVGASTVTETFVPADAFVGAAITIITLVAVALSLSWTRIRPRKVGLRRILPKPSH